MRLVQEGRALEVDCLKAKGKKELMTEANLAQVVSTQVSTSQADGSDSDSSVISLCYYSYC